MGFFQSLGRLIKGEPVYQPGDQPQQQQGPQPQSGPMPAGPPTSAPAPTGPKVLPQVMIDRWQCVENGAGLHCEINIRNYSQGGITLDRIELLNTRDQLGNFLDPGEEYEYQFQLQQRPHDTYANECKLYFKNEAGDYFMAVHQVEFEKQPDNTYSIQRFRLLPPIRDV